ncbi:MAG: T9SS type A sorting domain-containing protein [Saprospiraceae bacterium]
MKDYRKLLVCLPIFTLPFLFSELSNDNPASVQHFHSKEEIAAFEMMVVDTLLPDLYNELFAASGACAKCHGYDTLGVASVDVLGEDINVVDDWRATMMGNSAKDPFWRAKVSHEILLHQQHKEALEDKCTSCHAPLGHFNAKHIGLSHYGIDDLVNDEMGQDGVSCLACHQISPDSLGLSFSGEVRYDTFKVAYGPYENPLVSPMLTETGYKPYFSEHISDAGICASCHTLITETIDYAGNFTGNKFVEQATYHEWLNSAYKDSVSCQGCHMPSLDKWPVRLVTGAQTEPRMPFYLHELVGGNVTILKLLQNNIDQLGIKASAAQFDEVIENTLKMLQKKTLQLEIDLIERTLDTARFELSLTNLAGHKFPSGYPARRAFIEFLVTKESGDTLFISGKTDENFEVYGQNPTYEPHYQSINSEEQVQIYEMVFGDVNGDVSTVLVRGDHPIKDNRLPPKGFTTTSNVYDTTLIAGNALADPDFNKVNNVEGSGSDLIYYNIPLNGYYEVLEITAKVYYQSTPPKWMKEMFDETTPEIETFRTMFDEADRSPILVKTASIFAEAISNSQEVLATDRFVNIYPVPTTDGKLTVQSNRLHQTRVYSVSGQLVQVTGKQSGQYAIQLKSKGIFILKFTDQKGRVQVERIIVD